ncbi:MAG: hypothetical protein ACKVX7_13720 [Planctomycetota bacterium]
MSDIDQLLQPTITADEDFGGIRHPWNPSFLLILTFFCGFQATGWLIAQNCARLGIARRAIPLRIATVCYTLALLGAYGYFEWRAAERPENSTKRLLDSVRKNTTADIHKEMVALFAGEIRLREPELAEKEVQRRAREMATLRATSATDMPRRTLELLKYGSQGLGVAVGAFAMRTHFRRFRIAQMQNAPTGKFWPVVLIGILINTLVGFGVAGILMWVN